jgi:hypothetical protein
VISESKGSPIRRNNKNSPKLRRKMRVNRFEDGTGGTVTR